MIKEVSLLQFDPHFFLREKLYCVKMMKRKQVKIPSLKI